MPGENKRDSSLVITSLAHLYRGEVARADAWRSRLDNTTNWALTTTAAVLSFGLGSASASHAVFLVGMYLVINFLLIETRRYRAWDVYLRRVRLLEVGLYSPLLREETLDTRHLRELATMLDAPRIVIPFWSALGQRIKRAYGPVLAVLLVAWVVRLSLFPSIVRSFPELVQRMHVAGLPGWLVLVFVALTYLALGSVLALGLLVSPPSTELLVARRRRAPLRDALVRRPARAPMGPPRQPVVD